MDLNMESNVGDYLKILWCGMSKFMSYKCLAALSLMRHLCLDALFIYGYLWRLFLKHLLIFHSYYLRTVSVYGLSKFLFFWLDHNSGADSIIVTVWVNGQLNAMWLSWTFSIGCCSFRMSWCKQVISATSCSFCRLNTFVARFCRLGIDLVYPGIKGWAVYECLECVYFHIWSECSVRNTS